jgi:CrcB protein
MPPPRSRWDIVLVIAVGGALGSLARWAVGEALPHRPDQVAWNTVLVNIPGALALGLLMVLVVDVWAPTRYVRPFLGVGVLGGYTTFSTYMLDTRDLLAAGRPGPAFAYLFGTLLVGLVAVWVGILLGRSVAALMRRTRSQR